MKPIICSAVFFPSIVSKCSWVVVGGPVMQLRPQAWLGLVPPLNTLIAVFSFCMTMKSKGNHMNATDIFIHRKAKVTTYKSYALWLKIPLISLIQHLSHSGGHLCQSVTAVGGAILHHISLSQLQSLTIPLAEWLILLKLRRKTELAIQSVRNIRISAFACG